MKLDAGAAACCLPVTSRHVQRREQRRGAVAFVVVGHGTGAALLHRQTGLGTVKRLDLELSSMNSAAYNSP